MAGSDARPTPSYRSIRDVIKRLEVVRIASDASVREACKLMAEQRVGAVLVMDGEGLEGIFTERDALNQVLAEGLDADATLVAEVMTANPITLAPGAAAIDALRLMSEVGFRHIPIVEEGRVFGVISIRDFIGAELQQAGAHE